MVALGNAFVYLDQEGDAECTPYPADFEFFTSGLTFGHKVQDTHLNYIHTVLHFKIYFLG